jgi:Mg2+ and Co2+ transporter CorA
MNVPVPFAESANGFLYVSIMSAVISIGGALILWKKDMF